MTRFYVFRFVSVCFHLSRPILLSISFIRVQFVSPFLPLSFPFPFFPCPSRFRFTPCSPFPARLPFCIPWLVSVKNVDTRWY